MPESSYCALVKHGISVLTDGTLRPCCKFDDLRNPPQERFKFTHLREFKSVMSRLDQSLEQGIQDIRCRACWDDEKLGYKSLRQYSNEMYNATGQRMDHHDTWHMEIKLGNYCNLRCLMCSPMSSSSIETEFQENQAVFASIGLQGLDTPIGKWWATDEFDRFLDSTLDDVKCLHFTGGEPFIVPRLADMLLKVKNPGDTDLLFVTNMTKLNTRAIEIARNFRTVSITISLEGTGEKNNYIRYPSDFSTIESNIKAVARLSKDNLKWNISHTFQHSSIYSLPDLFEWANALGLQIIFGSVYGREYLDINSVPPGDIERFQRWVENTQFPDGSMEEYIKNKLIKYKFDPELYRQFRKYVKTLDDIRGTNYDAVFNPSAMS